LGIFAFLLLNCVIEVNGNSTFAALASSDDVDNEEDGGDNWIFSRSPLSNNPQGNRQTGQNGQPRPVYSAYSMPTPQYFNADPFFQMNTDKMFFMNHPDPFYDEPSGYPGYNSGVFGADRFIYPLDRPYGYNYDNTEN
jgi:hypothetical protein